MKGSIGFPFEKVSFSLQTETKKCIKFHYHKLQLNELSFGRSRLTQQFFSPSHIEFS